MATDPPAVAADKPQGRMIAAGPYLQGGTVLLLLSGGVVGKGAYDDIRDGLNDTKIEMATTRQAVEAWSGRFDSHESRPHEKAEDLIQDLRSDVIDLERRLARAETKLEMVQDAQKNLGKNRRSR